MALRRLRAALAVLALVLASLVAGVGYAGQASASCENGVRVLRTLQGTSGIIYGREDTRTAGSGTCDGDSVYLGRVFDAINDGRCVYAYYSSSSSGPWTAQGVACTTGAWSNYSYTDPQGNSSAWMQLCAGTLSSANHYCRGPWKVSGF